MKFRVRGNEDRVGQNVIGHVGGHVEIGPHSSCINRLSWLSAVMIS